MFGVICAAMLWGRRKPRGDADRGLFVQPRSVGPLGIMWGQAQAHSLTRGIINTKADLPRHVFAGVTFDEGRNGQNVEGSMFGRRVHIIRFSQNLGLSIGSCPSLLSHPLVAFTPP